MSRVACLISSSGDLGEAKMTQGKHGAIGESKQGLQQLVTSSKTPDSGHMSLQSMLGCPCKHSCMLNLPGGQHRKPLLVPLS